MTLLTAQSFLGGGTPYSLLRFGGRQSSKVSYSATVSGVAVNQTDTWTVPIGVRWRVIACDVYLNKTDATSRQAQIQLYRQNVGSVGLIISDTGAQNVAAAYSAVSDTAGNGGTTGSVKVTLPGEGVLLLPGDSVNILLNAAIGDTITVQMIFLVENDQ